MKVVDHAPWFLFLIRWRVGQPPPTAIMTYGSSIYRLSGSRGQLPLDLLVHEETHARQQGRTPWLWWARYLVSARFRVAQEAEAYRAQLESVTLLNRNKRNLVRRELAGILSSSMYGNAVSAQAAWEMLGGGWPSRV